MCVCLCANESQHVFFFCLACVCLDKSMMVGDILWEFYLSLKDDGLVIAAPCVQSAATPKGWRHVHPLVHRK